MGVMTSEIELEQTNTTVTICRVPHFSGEFRLLLLSDLHIDSVYCDRAVLKRHLERGVQEGAYIAIAGDVLAVNVDSVATVQQVLLYLQLRRV